jgi:UMF1 family MFS transporter
VIGSSPDKAYRRRIRAWTLYDWANHGYVTVTATTFFPPYFVAVASPAFAAGAGAVQARDTASNVFAFAVSGALLTVALLAPIVGTVADLIGSRKRLLLVTTCLRAALASAMVAITTGRWVLALALYFASQIAVNIAFGLNSSLLPHLARPDDIGHSSALGYAMGYVGGGLLLAIATAAYLLADKLGISRDVAVRATFFAVGVWWLGFAIPLAANVPEPPAAPLAHGTTGNPIRDALIRLRRTLRDLRGRRELFTMLLAFWLYMEGIGAIILLATAYGAALGLPTGALIGTLLLTQFVAFPYALAFGRIPDPTAARRGRALAMVLWTAVTLPALGCFANHHRHLGVSVTLALVAADQLVGLAFARTLGDATFERLAARLDSKRAIALGLAIYTIIPIWGFFLRTQAEFFLIGVLVGTVQGGTQALSRAVYVALSPRAKSGEFFGLYALSEKFAGILGPLLYAVVGELTHNPRASILSIALFFALGIAVLSRVDVEAGRRVAAAEDAAIATARIAD